MLAVKGIRENEVRLLPMGNRFADYLIEKDFWSIMNKEAAAFLTKERYDFSDLCTVMKLLRAPGGLSLIHI